MTAGEVAVVVESVALVEGMVVVEDIVVSIFFVFVDVAEVVEVHSVQPLQSGHKHFVSHVSGSCEHMESHTTQQTGKITSLHDFFYN